MIESRFEQLANHLGLVFHRFLERGQVRIRMDAIDPASGNRGFAQDVIALNPFRRPRATRSIPATSLLAFRAATTCPCAPTSGGVTRRKPASGLAAGG